ncbi:cation:proton antiporter [Acuticoccus sp. I52.16.1]|uniref:cation:proton antiporter domain-containing protein n=1 Tax=Acuticoccus sp. I52.16.1 TaxID=2928472 RepID=UPI001FD34BD8|nr:cation:proton antiporter [Acuticoccus sp. I52.16.1]UOM35978.1 cation:proton antiporter [Acuticoccus sp. I52.16.1]
MEGEASHTVPYIKEATIFLVSAGIVVPILQRFGINTILGYLIAGIAVGPYGIIHLTDDIFGVPLALFTITDTEGVRQIAELGVVFLLFLIGLELSAPRLWAMRRLVFGLGGLQVVVTAVALTGAGLAAGLQLEPAVAVGAALALSSTAIVVQLLIGAGRLASPSGQVMFSILLMQDIAVVPVLLVIGSMAGAGDTSVLMHLAKSLALAAAMITAILLAGRRVLAPVLRFTGARQDRDMFTAAALLVILATAELTSMAGLSMALGAFLAGLVFADTEFSHQLEVEIAPFKGLLLGLFFLSVGMTIDPGVVLEQPLTLLAIITVVSLIKAVIITVLALAFRQPLAVAVESGLMLAQIGEFSLVGLSLAYTLGVVPSDVAKLLVVSAGVAMALTTASSGLIHRLTERLVSTNREAVPSAASLGTGAPDDHVIIAGFGRIGRSIGALLDAHRIPYLALEMNSRAVTQARSKDLPVYFGDVRRLDVLQNAHVSTARAIILTMDSPAANADAVRHLRQAGLTVPVIVRARDTSNASELYALGADEVVLEAFEASLQMGEETLVAIGFPRDAAHSIIEERRDTGRRDLANAALSRPEGS